MPVKKFMCVLKEIFASHLAKIWIKLEISKKLIPSSSEYFFLRDWKRYINQGKAKNKQKLFLIVERGIWITHFGSSYQQADFKVKI